MRRTIRNVISLLLAAGMIVSALTVEAFAKSDKPAKSGKADKETASETAAPTASAVPSAVTLEDAKEIALNHANVDSTSAVFSKEKLDKGVYELKFNDCYGKYEYEIAAVSGTIIDFQWEIKNLRSAIPLELAKEIALNHAGVNSDDAAFTKEELDEAIYKLKFNSGSSNYEYDISAIDGMILDYEWDASASGAAEKDPAWEESIPREQVCQIALDFVGVDQASLKYLVCYISWANHVPAAYEVKFATRWAAYHYTIDLNTGTILDSACYPHR